MAPEEIIRDLHNGKVKRVFADGDFAAEIDDQYALAYCVGSPSINLVGVGASAFYEEPNNTDTETVMLRGVDEARLTLDALGSDCPLYDGARTRISANEGFAPTDCPSARAIISEAKKAACQGETLYTVVTGPCTSVVSACLLDPSITDLICVVWLGGNCVETENKPFHEWNLYADYAASQLLLNLPVPLVLLPCDPVGSVMIRAGHDDFDLIGETGRGAEFFRRTLPLRLTTEEKLATTWSKVMCDLMGPAVLALPDAMRLEIIPAPVMCDDRRYAIDQTRRKILYGTYPESAAIVADAMRAIGIAVR